MGELLDYAERLTRAEIKTWPKGRYDFIDHIDNDGFSDTPIPIKVAITVRDDGTLLVDYTGSSPQVKGALNSTLSFTHSLTYLSVRCVLPKDVPNNVGFFRCIEVKVPEASVLNPVMPGPCAARALTGYRVFDTMLGALAQIVPERVPAAGEGGNSVICISGLQAQPQALHHRRHDLRRLGRAAGQGRAGGRHQRLAEPLQHAGGGDGGRASRARRGICLRARHLRRGQMARRRRPAARPIASWRPRRCCRCAPTASCSSPTGSSGGEPGGRSRNFIEIGNRREPLPGKMTMTVPHDAVIIHEQAGAGGFGDPLARDPGAGARGSARRQDQRGVRAPASRRHPGWQWRHRYEGN